MEEVLAPGLVLRWLRVDVTHVVTLNISWPVPLATTPQEELLDQMAVGLLDRGAGVWSEEAVATFLEDRGVELHFSLGSGYVRCRVRMLQRHLSDVLSLVVACMNEPLMAASSFETVSARLRSNLMQARSRTAARASTGLRQHIFAPGHPEYAFSAEERLVALDDVSASDVARNYRQRLRPTRLHAAVVGDVNGDHADRVARVLSESSETGEAVAHITPELARMDPVRVHIPLTDRSNLDVRIGHGIPLRRTHEAYDALKTGIFALGGNFSARLMTTVRDRDGLTYGIGSSLSGVDVDWSGMWVTSLSLSASALLKGIEATLSEIRLFIDAGISDDERRAVVGTLTGSARVQIGTTSGLAQVMLRHMERGEPATEMDAWAERIERLTTRQINDALGTWLDAERLHVVSAGTAPPETAEPGPVSDPA